MGKDQDFFDAARNGNISVIEKVLNQRTKRSGPLASLRRGPGVNVQDGSGYTALHHACLNGNSDVVRLLLAYEASTNYPDSRGSSPLHLAAWAGHSDIVKMLLVQPFKPANPNLQTIENETPLHCAAQHGHIRALGALLSHGANPNIRNIRNETPLDLAAQYGRFQAVQMLIRYHPELIHSHSYENTKQDLPAHTCLHLASRNGHKRIVEVLLDAGVNINLRTTIGSALHEAALCGKKSVVRTLLKAGIDINTTDVEGRTALDILKEFPPHVTKDIISIINCFQNPLHVSKEEKSQLQAPMPNLGSSLQVKPAQRLHSHYYNFNSNNHLLNHTLLVQQSMQHSSKYYNNKYNGNTCAVSKDGIQQLNIDDLTDEVECYAGTGNLSLFASTTSNTTNEVASSPSSSLSNFKPNLVSPRSRSLNGGIISAPPRKPPRRNLSVSPIQNIKNQPSSVISRYYRHPNNKHSLHESIDYTDSDFSSTTQAKAHQDYQHSYESTWEVIGPCEYTCLDYYGSGSDNALTSSVSNDVLNHHLSKTLESFESSAMSKCISKSNGFSNIATTRHLSGSQNPVRIIGDLINPILKSYNPNRKLKRNRNSCSLGGSLIFMSSDTNSSEAPETAQPQSPTNYLQPPTPEHPPPSVNQAERMIHERMRPLSQEYKRKSTWEIMYQTQQQKNINVEKSTSPPTLDPLHINSPKFSQSHNIDCGVLNCETYAIHIQCDSSGSLSSSISYSDCSASTDCVEEFIGDVPFAGLLKGSSGMISRNQLKICENIGSNFCQTRIILPESIKDYPNHLNDKKKLELTDNELCSENISRQKRIKSYLERRHESASLQEIANSTRSSSDEINILSPFNEEEAWERISEIIESFGSGLLNTDTKNSFDSSGLLFDFDYDNDPRDMPSEQCELSEGLRRAGLMQIENLLFENGYDNFKFLNGVLNENDIRIMNITQSVGLRLIKFVKTLPVAVYQPYGLGSNTQDNKLINPSLAVNNGVSTLSEWLSSIDLLIYVDCFKKHLYNNIESVSGVWDVELQTILEINKLGHRRRILQSLDFMREEQQHSKLEAPQNENETKDSTQFSNVRSCNQMQPKQQQISSEKGQQKKVMRSVRPVRKNRPAPPPPEGKALTKNTDNFEIRAPSELLLGLPSNLRTKWLHSALVLVKEKLKYEVYYLGSTFVKELRGTESTRQSIQKLKRDNQINGTKATSTKCFHSTLTKTATTIFLNQENSLSKFHPNNELISPTQLKGRISSLVCLAISQSGVEFIDVKDLNSICEHKIQNINCACQDSTDLSYFAYITKEKNLHYCHVFHVHSASLATEIILTLGQAFEVAYQLALRSNKSSPEESINPRLEPAGTQETYFN